ncbi:monooxygenase, putative [hydrothermal vent metagenome]|uniref:Monooxygenase, putative n=1 Tax=hydrothermal vent metagenome TaxID=652676 RepID=A0A3B0ZV02_9ZZZZ
MINDSEYDVIIIGAGQCGVLLSYYLEQDNISYLIIEKDRAFSSWYNKRWNGFKMNTANWMNNLPGELNSINDNNLINKKQIINQFEQWSKSFSPRINFSEVKNVNFQDGYWNIESDSYSYETKIVVFAVGLNKTYIPKLPLNITSNVQQMHSINYIAPEQIKTKNVLIVGSGSSGVQICDELARIKKYNITLATSNNKYFPNSIFGISIYSYVKKLKVFDIRSKSLFGRLIRNIAQNKGDPATYPKPSTLRDNYGVVLRGKVIKIIDNIALFKNDKTLTLNDTTIIWCTGFRVDISSIIDNKLKSTLITDQGYPILKTDFESVMPNLFFIGLRFLRLVSSHSIYGAVRDAKYLALEIKSKIKQSN